MATKAIQSPDPVGDKDRPNVNAGDNAIIGGEPGTGQYIGTDNRAGTGTTTGTRTGTRKTSKTKIKVQRTRDEGVSPVRPVSVKIETEPGVSPVGPEKQAIEDELNLNIDAAQAAGLLLTLANGLAMAAVGPTAEMNDGERGLIEPALTRLIKKYQVTPETLSKYSDPLLLAVGGLMWINRLRAIRQEQTKTPKEKVIDNLTQTPADLTPEPEPQPDNGRADVDIGEITAAPELYHNLITTP